MLINNHLNETKMRKGIIYILLLVTGLSGCMLGPNYQRPAVESSSGFRFDSIPGDSIINLSWWELFGDDQLEALIKLALENNKDMKIAATRIEEARAMIGIARSDMFPRLDMGVEAGASNLSGAGNQQTGVTESYYIAPTMSWEIDFWGKYRRAKEAAIGELLASEYAYRTIQISLISELVSAYFTLLDYDQRLDISRRTLVTREESLRIMRERFEKGITPELDLNQAQMQKAIAAASVPFYERYVAYTENVISVLTGSNPSAIIRSNTLKDQVIPPDIPVGLPSELLERRPDVIQAEQLLAAQTARIGVAQAQRLPSINLTGMMGLSSADLSNLVSGDALVWSAGGSILGPIFYFGQNKRRVEIEQYRTERALYTYEQTILDAFREVEDALVDVSTYKREHEARKYQLEAAQNAEYLSNERYLGGVTSYLEVLESQRSYFQAELSESEALRNRLNAYVSLYKALGGGWVSEQEKNPAPPANTP